MRPPGARFHFGAGAVRSCARGRDARTAIPRDTGLPVRRPGRVHPRSDPRLARGGAKGEAPRQVRSSAPASRSQVPAQAHAPTATRDAAHAHERLRYDRMLARPQRPPSAGPPAAAHVHPELTGGVNRAKRPEIVRRHDSSIYAPRKFGMVPHTPQHGGVHGGGAVCARTRLGAFQSCTEFNPALQNL